MQTKILPATQVQAPMTTVHMPELIGIVAYGLLN